MTSYGSAATILYSKLSALNAKKTLDVAVISSPNTVGEIRKPPVRHIIVNIERTVKPIADLRSIWRMYRILRREKFDIVHSHTAKAGFITAVAARMARVPLVFHTYHGLPFFDGQSRISYILSKALEKIACKFRDHILTQNQRDFPECVNLMGSPQKTSIEGNGVDVEYVIHSGMEQLAEARRDYLDQSLKLVMLSRLEPVKRPFDLLDILYKLLVRGIDFSCVIAGSGPLEHDLKTRIAALELDARVRMVGRSNYPHGLILASDIVILCSEKEGIPRSLMEAMALKKPVVATDVLGTQELVDDGRTGFLVPLGDTGAMAERIMQLAQNLALRERMGAAGQQRVLDHFNDLKIADFLCDFYLDAWKKRTS